MGLEKLRFKGIRNLQENSLEFDEKFNIVAGPNGSGKSSLLEAIYILGTGKSFRTNQIREVISRGDSELLVNGSVQGTDGGRTNLGISFQGNHRTIRIDGSNLQSRVELARKIPVQIIWPGSFQLIEGSPGIRRKFIDWGLFHSVQDYHFHWTSYNRALLQRNACLRSGGASGLNGLEIWNRELAKYGTIITRHRAEYLRQFNPFFNNLVSKFLPGLDLQIVLHTGWNEKSDFPTALDQSIDRDLKLGYTSQGPHRCEFRVLADDVTGRSFLSRGQIKLLVLALKFSQINFHASGEHAQGCFLIDDLGSEIDHHNACLIIEFLQGLDIQFFITSIDTSIKKIFSDCRTAMFHVEQGSITPAKT